MDRRNLVVFADGFRCIDPPRYGCCGQMMMTDVGVTPNDDFYDFGIPYHELMDLCNLSSAAGDDSTPYSLDGTSSRQGYPVMKGTSSPERPRDRFSPIWLSPESGIDEPLSPIVFEIGPGSSSPVCSSISDSSEDKIAECLARLSVGSSKEVLFESDSGIADEFDDTFPMTSDEDICRERYLDVGDDCWRRLESDAERVDDQPKLLLRPRLSPESDLDRRDDIDQVKVIEIYGPPGSGFWSVSDQESDVAAVPTAPDSTTTYRRRRSEDIKTIRLVHPTPETKRRKRLKNRILKMAAATSKSEENSSVEDLLLSRKPRSSKKLLRKTYRTYVVNEDCGGIDRSSLSTSLESSNLDRWRSKEDKKRTQRQRGKDKRHLKQRFCNKDAIRRPMQRYPKY